MSSPMIPTPSQEAILEAEPGVTTSTEEAQKEIAGRSLTQIAWSRLRRDKVAMTALVVILLVILVAIFAPLITRLLGVDTGFPDGEQLKSLISNENGGLPKTWTNSCQGFGAFALHCGGISLQHPFGIEPNTGRDVFALLINGSRISLTIAFVSTFFVVLFGIILGTMAGYLGGTFDGILGRFMDLLLSFPTLLMLLALTPVFTSRWPGNGSRVVYMIVFFAFFSWPYLARIVRGQVISMREREFVEAARAMGAGSRRIIFKELIPNLWAPILVYSSLLLPSFIAFEAALSYLGVGVLPPTVTWGQMLGESVSFFQIIPTYLFIPGMYLFIVVLAFNLFGDAVRDALDPRAGRV